MLLKIDEFPCHIDFKNLHRKYHNSPDLIWDLLCNTKLNWAKLNSLSPQWVLQLRLLHWTRHHPHQIPMTDIWEEERFSKGLNVTI